MNGSDNHIEYNSANIGKKPKAELLINIQKPNKVKKFLNSDSPLLIISAVTAAVTLCGLIATIVLFRPSSEDMPPEILWQQEIDRIRNEASDFSPNTNGQEVDAVIADIDNKISDAEANDDFETAYQLKLLKIDVLTKTGMAFAALNINIISMLVELEATSEPGKFYDLYTRAYIASKDIGDAESARSYLESIVALPGEAFPERSDDTFMQHYEKLLEEWQ
jgi:hypothetical protein